MTDAGPDRLRALRLEAGLTLDQLAGLLDTTRQTVIRWEQARSRPNEDYAQKLSRVFAEQLSRPITVEEFRPPRPLRPHMEERLQLAEESIADLADELRALRQAVEALLPPQRAECID